MLYEAPCISTFCLKLGTGYLCAELVSFCTIQLECIDATTASVPLTHPEPIFVFTEDNSRSYFDGETIR